MLVDWLYKNRKRWSCNANITADNRARGPDLTVRMIEPSIPLGITPYTVITVIGIISKCRWVL